MAREVLADRVGQVGRDRVGLEDRADQEADLTALIGQTGPTGRIAQTGRRGTNNPRSRLK